MTAVTAPMRPTRPAGRTIVRPQALRRMAAAAVAELTGVRPSDVSVDLTEVRGLLAIGAVTPLNPRTARVSGTLVEQAAAITAELTSRIGRLADRTVGRVELRLTRLIDGRNERRVE